QQHGETTFRYAIASGTGQQAAAGLVDPFLAVPLTGTTRTPDLHVFADVAHPQVHVSSLVRSRRGHDLVAHLRSTASTTVDTTVRLAYGVRAAYLGTSLERDLRPVPVRDGVVEVSLPAGAFMALVLDLGRSE